MKLIKWLDDHLEETLLIVLLVLISCVQLAQVVCRNIPFITSLKWSEEFCRFCWIWTVFLSLPYTIRKGNMLRVSVLVDLFPWKLRSITHIFVEVLITAAMLLMAVHSISVVGGIVRSGETSPAMLWPMWCVYSVLLIGFFLGVVRGVQQIWLQVRSFGMQQATTLEQTIADAAAEVEAGRKAEGGQM